MTNQIVLTVIARDPCLNVMNRFTVKPDPYHIGKRWIVNTDWVSKLNNSHCLRKNVEKPQHLDTRWMLDLLQDNLHLMYPNSREKAEQFIKDLS